MTKIWKSWEQKELLTWNKKHFSSFLKDFRLPKVVSDLRARLYNLISFSDFIMMGLSWNILEKKFEQKPRNI